MSRDPNHTPPAYAKSSAGDTLLPLLIDPVTGRLMIAIAAVASLPATSAPSAKIDANREVTAQGVSDDGNQTPMPFLTDDDGNLICDIVVET